MTQYAEETCATCHAIKPMNEMREVKVKRVTGKSYSSGATRGNRNSRSNSYSSSGSFRNSSGSSNSTKNRSSTRTNMSVYREWVCKGCPAPKSDMSPTMRNGIIFTILGTLLLAWCTANPSRNNAGREAVKETSAIKENSQGVIAPTDVIIQNENENNKPVLDELIQPEKEIGSEVPPQAEPESVEPEIVFQPGTGVEASGADE